VCVCVVCVCVCSVVCVHAHKCNILSIVCTTEGGHFLQVNITNHTMGKLFCIWTTGQCFNRMLITCW